MLTVVLQELRQAEGVGVGQGDACTARSPIGELSCALQLIAFEQVPFVCRLGESGYESAGMAADWI